MSAVGRWRQTTMNLFRVKALTVAIVAVVDGS